jgi:hypothetical protein
LSTVNADGYDEFQGTSMATPHVAGVAGLLYSVNPSLDQATIYQILKATSIDIGVAGKDIYYGHGLINAARAVAYVIEGFSPQIQPSAQQMDILSPEITALMKPQRDQDIDVLLSHEHADDSVLVALKKGPELKALGFESLNTAEEAVAVRHGVEIEGQNPDIKIVRLAPGQNVKDMIRKLAGEDAVLLVQPNYLYKPL